MGTGSSQYKDQLLTKARADPPSQGGKKGGAHAAGRGLHGLPSARRRGTHSSSTKPQSQLPCVMKGLSCKAWAGRKA